MTRRAGVGNTWDELGEPVRGIKRDGRDHGFVVEVMYRVRHLARPNSAY